MSRLVLASQSPRRLELLSRFGIPFETFVPAVDESCDLPADEAVRLLFLTLSFLPRILWFPWMGFPSANPPAPRMPSACSGCFPAVRTRSSPVFLCVPLPAGSSQL